MNKKVYLCDIEALREGTNDKYGVSATLVFNEGLTYKELEQVINEKYFYLSNNNLQEENKKLKDKYERCKKQKIKVENACSNYKYKLDKAIDKLYCWGEVLDAQFQQEMLNILGVENDDQIKNNN